MGNYTVITFSPVQEFIEKSRKLRDLYGSSLILSYLGYYVIQAALAQGIDHISPRVREKVRGTPDYIIFDGYFAEEDAEAAFNSAWGNVVITCRQWLREQFPDRQYTWNRHWNNWKNHAWEFFWGEGDTITAASQNLYDRNYHRRAWVGINWEGDSSALSGADAIAFPDMLKSNPMKSDYPVLMDEIRTYYEGLSYQVGKVYLESIPQLDRRYKGEEREAKIKEYGEAIISPREYLNIPELIKRLVTLEVVAERINNSINVRLTESQDYLRQAFQNTDIDILDNSFQDINRHEENNWSGWFMGDGDRMGEYTCNLSASELKQFSEAFIGWGEGVFREEIEENQRIGRLVYAGGDDFMGIFVPNRSSKPLTGIRCWSWWRDFPQIWQQHNYSDDISVSVGFVWAAPDVPQRGIIQHCKSAEKNAKDSGRDRIALRILFNSGNHLEWTCPWWFLGYLERYRQDSWVKIYQDIAVLESRHSFSKQDTSVARGIFAIYFGKESLEVFNCLWNVSEDYVEESPQVLARLRNGLRAGILGDRHNYQNPVTQELDDEKVNQALNNWVINLAKVGFHLFRDD